MSNKIVFLDFDGVICTQESYSKARKKFGNTHTGFPPPFQLIVSELVGRVEEICDATNASIVISSTWRFLHEWEELLGFLHNHGLRTPVIDKTPDDLDTINRADEIAAWLKLHPEIDLKDIVILDDDVGAFDPEEHYELRKRLIATDFINTPKCKAGLQPSHVSKAIGLLK